LRAAVKAVAILALLLLGYFVAVAIGAVVRIAEADPGEGPVVTIYVASNGFHTDLVLPATTLEKDWSGLLAASPITRPAIGRAEWVAFGWGSEAAYTQLGTLADLSPAIALRALAFDRSVLHVAPGSEVVETDGVQALQLSASGYRRLVGTIEAAIALDEAGAPRPLHGVTQGLGDAFFHAHGRFSLFRGCNVWTSEALRAAGIPIGVWTPFAQTLMWSLRRDAH
jgi:uncharacterized protein (TIGR02117 family)